MPVAIRQRLYFQHDRTLAHFGEDVQLIEFVLWGHLKEHVYTVLPRTVEGLLARLQAAMTMADAKILNSCLREFLALHCCLS